MSWNSFCYLFGTEQNLSFSYCFSAEFAAAAVYLILAAHFPSRKKEQPQQTTTYFLPHYLNFCCVTKIFVTFRLNPLTLYVPHPTTLLQDPFPSDKREGGERCNLWLETAKDKQQRLLNTIISASFSPSEVN